MDTKIVNIDGIDLEVQFELKGRYHPATRIDPPDYPELIVNTICVIDSSIDIQSLLSQRQLEEIDLKIWDELGYE